MCVIQSKLELIMGPADLSMALDLLLNWHGRDDELVNMIGTFLHFIKNQLGEQQWSNVTKVFPNFVKSRIVEFYKC